MQKQLAQKLADLPQKPGVYVFKDAKGFILYVGKAVKLKNRVNSYFKYDAGFDRGPRIQLMISQIADLDYTVVSNETESLILENNYIKQFKPKYNVMLRDDKNYLFLKINLKDEIPTIGFERKLMDKNARYFGPYTSGYELKNTLRLVRKIFPYCANSKVGTKPCFYYHIGKCPGVCFGKISLEDYRNNYIKKIIQFLEGKQTEILKDLQSQMRILAAHKKFEQAAKIRNQIFALNRVLERQKIIYPRKIDQDVFSVFAEGTACINLFIIREGKLIQKENFILDNAKGLSISEILQSFLERYYLEASNIPKEILLPAQINQDELFPVFIGRRVPTITSPTRGQKLQLIKLGTENAKQYLESTSDKLLLEEARLLASLKELQRVLDLPDLPARMECFDISNIQGTNAVGSMVVFDYAHPKKDQYRKFKIRKKSTPDDFGMMREMLERRFANDWPMPNLIIIDGGKGQLSTAVSVLKQNKLTIPIVGLAKRLEEIFLPGKKNSIILPVNSQALFLLQRIRDEAHRFAITYHKKLRSKSAVSSVFDQIGGVGEAKKKLLLQKFGSTAKVREASITELAAIVGSKLAEKIKASL